MASPISDKIEDLIVATTDPSQKALLLILQKMEGSLHENTLLTRGLSSTLTAHVADETQLYAKIQGGTKVAKLAWAVIFTLLGVIQGVSLYVFDQHMAAFHVVVEEVHSLQRFQSAHEAHHRTEETRP
jgi:hypothetical protein